MKKLIISMVFVFAFVAVTPTSAKNTLVSKDIVATDCVALAFDIQTAFEYLFSKEEANGIASLAYDVCIAKQQ